MADAKAALVAADAARKATENHAAVLKNGDMDQKLQTMDREVKVGKERLDQEHDRVLELENLLQVERGKTTQLDQLPLELSQVQREKSDVVKAKDVTNAVLSEMIASDQAAKGDRIALEANIKQLEADKALLKSDLDTMDNDIRKKTQMIRQLEDSETLLKTRVKHVESTAEDTVNALRKELNRALADLSEQNNLVGELQAKQTRAVEEQKAVVERDALNVKVKQVQEDL